MIWPSVHNFVLLNHFQNLQNEILVRFMVTAGPVRISLQESASSLSKTWKDIHHEPGVINTLHTYRNFTLRVNQGLKQCLYLLGVAILAWLYARASEVTTKQRQRLGNRETRSTMNRSEWICGRRSPGHGGHCSMTVCHWECGGYGTLRSLSAGRYASRVPVRVGSEWLFRGMWELSYDRAEVVGLGWTGLVGPEGLCDGVCLGVLKEDDCMSQDTNKVHHLAPT